mmetsp:Transcript_1422/g.4242  ORF Transcript_1422/g.4242 Transcript_1422/m.4242 type:complete len:89 (+) Transcript_1422:1251-1517(+)
MTAQGTVLDAIETKGMLQKSKLPSFDRQEQYSFLLPLQNCGNIQSIISNVMFGGLCWMQLTSVNMTDLQTRHAKLVLAHARLSGTEGT